ncbi:hypothetical protein ACXHWJ_16825 [Alcaligenes nematophilus]
MLNIFENLNIPDDKLHTKFKIIRDNLSLTGEQIILNDWVAGFQDRDNKIVKEFQTTFHSSFWEFYIHSLLKESGFEIDFSKHRPDFIITKPAKFYIECVVANIKEKGSKESERTMNDILSMIQPHWQQEDFDETMRESITRYSNAFLSKSIKHEEYIEDPSWDSTAPYVIALSGYEQINYGNNFNYAMLAFLYGIYFNPKDDTYSKKQNILKPNSKSSIPIGIFLTKEFSHVSAVIFSCTVTLGKLTSLAISQKKSSINLNAVMCIRHDNEEPQFKPQIVSPESPEYLSDGVFVFHNPFADNPLPKNAFNNTNVIQVEFDRNTETISSEGKNLPIVSRLNLAGGHGYISEIIPKIFKSFNPDLIFCLAKVVEISENYEANSYDVIFQDVEDEELQFTLVFDNDKLLQHGIKKNKNFQAIFKLPNKYRITDLDGPNADNIRKLRKLACFELGDGHLVSLSERI